ncbi:hypothetical protein [Mycolicibacterium hippocampi]|uniref:hypothetical protein n=1 Tax=Mycolicibacterium hippocampi TaxID=659824 RepID=UPI001F389D1B|nr:hypothetical protein [Mycolicibacterium hippocampi]
MPNPSAHPAPGSAVPGAPPALKRSLTPADGVVDALSDADADASRAAETAAPQSNSGRIAGSGLHAAAAMAGVAVGLEIAGIISRRRNN